MARTTAPRRIALSARPAQQPAVASAQVSSQPSPASRCTTFIRWFQKCRRPSAILRMELNASAPESSRLLAANIRTRMA